MRIQAQIAIDTADVIMFLVDVKDGLLATDHDVYDMLRKTNKPVILVINKVDNIGAPPNEVYDFYNLAAGEYITISSSHGLGIGELLDAVYDHFPEETDEEDDKQSIKVSVIGKPNVGKSSLINKILGEERLIVTDIPGTTRDAVDTYIRKPEGEFIFIDTAGVRKKSKINDSIEHYSIIRSFSAVDKSDVCILLIDAEENVTEQDTKIAGYAHEQGKAIIVAVNKWDVVEKQTGTLENYRKDVYSKLAFMTYAPVVFI
jgi:GTP-binding protein